MAEEVQVPEAKVKKQDVIDNLLEFLPSETAITIELPSKGRFYPNHSGTVRVRPMEFADEKSILSARKGNLDPVNVLLERCVEGINIYELVQPDKLFILLRLREISYGEEYGATVTCQQCEFDNNLSFNLAKLPVDPIGDDLQYPLEINLPILKKKVTVRLPQVKDEEFLKNLDDATDQLWRFVDAVEEHTDKSIIAPVIQKLPLKDVHCLLKAINPEFGIQTKVKFTCQSCKFSNVIILPITADFFSVN